MSNLSLSRARRVLSETINRVHARGERVILERRGKPVAAIVSLEDLRRLEQLEDQINVAASMRALRRRGRNIPYTEARKKLGL